MFLVETCQSQTTPETQSPRRLGLAWPYRPQTNGKAEAFIKILQNEWAYARKYLSNHVHQVELEWDAVQNFHWSTLLLG